MSTTTLVLLVFLGLLTGGLAGIMGISGGVILIPALIYIFGFSQQQATGTSLAVLLPPIGFFATYNYYKAGYVNMKYAIIIAVAFMVGSYFSSKFLINMPENAIRKIFSVFLILIAVKMFFQK